MNKSEKDEALKAEPKTASKKKSEHKKSQGKKLSDVKNLFVKKKSEDTSSSEKKQEPKKKAEPKKSETKRKADAKPAAKKSSAKKTASKKSTDEKPKGLKYLTGLLFSKMARGGAAELSSNAEEVNKLNIFPVPDGDTGDNMRMTIESGVAALENIQTNSLSEVMKALSTGMLLGARGNSGVILSQFFAGTAKGFEGVNRADANTLGKALEMGVEQAYASVMSPTEGTILTVAREAVEYAVKRINPKSTIHTFFADLMYEMHASLDRTPEILTVLKEAEVVDSGGAGLLYIMDGFNRVLNGEKIQGAEQKFSTAAPSAIPSGFNSDSEMTYGYCTELLVQLQNKKTDVNAYDVEALKEYLSTLGDSIVAFKTGSIVKLHVHTLTPEKVLAHMREVGEFLTVKIENMSLQHSETETEKEAKTEPSAQEMKSDEPKKRYGIVSVCIGDGIEQLFCELGVDKIVEGGQTQNPSTNDFLDAFAKVNAETIFVFPNNGNIFMAASQAAEIYDKAKVVVIPSKSIGTGYVALTVFNPDNEDASAVEAEMIDAMNRVKCGYVSPSIRDADLNGIHINNGDTIGIVNKEIVISEAKRQDAAVGLTEKLVEGGERFMLTVFCGKDATVEERTELESKLREKFPELEQYFIDGGQDIYPYIFVAE